MESKTMSASENRLKWSELPAGVKSDLQQLTGVPARVTSCTGGFSPGLAVKIRLTDGRLVFVKAMDAGEWPDQADLYRAEVRVAAQLPSGVPSPRFLGSLDNGRWVILAFEGIDGHEPAQPWHPDELEHVVTALIHVARATPPPLPRDHPRLGGWTRLNPADLRSDGDLDWAADHLPFLIELEREGLAAAQGQALTHFDLYPHNIVLTGGQAFFVDWPYARLGAPFIDLLTVLSTASGPRIDQDAIVAACPLTADLDPATINAVLAALAGFALSGAFEAVPPGLKPITDAKLVLGLQTLRWLRRRAAGRG
jgi:Phosphotransferase enzyme family